MYTAVINVLTATIMQPYYKVFHKKETTHFQL